MKLFPNLSILGNYNITCVHEFDILKRYFCYVFLSTDPQIGISRGITMQLLSTVQYPYLLLFNLIQKHMEVDS